MSQVRTFIAVESSEEVRRAAGQLIQKLQPLSREVKWVEPENMHLTLKFLGDVDSEQLPQVYEAVQKAAAETRAFELQIRGVGAFPTLHRPNVFWLGVGQGIQDLEALAERIERALETLGFRPEDRPFHGHLTLGRVRRGGRIPPALREAFRTYADLEAGRFRVQQVTVFSSQLTPQGPIYTALAHGSLKSG